jgi:hypothetical protein
VVRFETGETVNISRQIEIPRRTFLRGLGATIALPLLDSMIPSRGLASQSPRRGPMRMAFVYVPNGANMVDWTPKKSGADFELPMILEPLKNVRSHIQVLSGLMHQKAAPNGDGAGDHARASATFLTGVQAYKTAGADIHIGVSADAVCAAKIGRATRLPSLELGIDRGQRAGNCDSGYACAYQFNISWRSPEVPNPPEINPRAVFDMMFGSGSKSDRAEDRAKREDLRKSILDFAMDDAKQMQARLDANDRAKLDEYLTSIREIEQRIENAKKFSDVIPDYAKKPSGLPSDYGQHVKLMFDLLALAFQTDNTRIATFIMAHDGSNRPYPNIGISEGHHDLSHHDGNEEKKAKIAKINRFHMTQFAAFLEKMQNTKEGDGTLLDHSMIVYGGGISDGNRHNHDDLPVLLAGGGCGTLQPGRHVEFNREPMTNLFLAMLDRMGASAERIGDSTGKLANI